MFQLNYFNGNDLMVLFNWGWPRLIYKLYLVRSLNLFASEARISKWSKYIKQLNSSKSCDTVDLLTILRQFPVKLEIPMCSAALVKRWQCPLPSNLAVTIPTPINKVRMELFLQVSLHDQEAHDPSDNYSYKNCLVAGKSEEPIIVQYLHTNTFLVLSFKTKNCCKNHGRKNFIFLSKRARYFQNGV